MILIIILDISHVLQMNLGGEWEVRTALISHKHRIEKIAHKYATVADLSIILHFQLHFHMDLWMEEIMNVQI